MSASAPTPANALLGILRRLSDTVPPSDAEVDTAVGDFVAHVTALDQKHNRKRRSERYLIEQVFRRSSAFGADVEYTQYCRCNLQVGLVQLKKLVVQLRDPVSGTLKASSLGSWTRVIQDYVFDLADSINFLQRKQVGYVYLLGHKNPTLHSWEVFVSARHLAYQVAFWGTGHPLNHKAAQIAAIGVLRQALELRFERLIAVYPRDKKGKSPRLKHGFHYEFVAAHPHFFKAQKFDVTDLVLVYDWCSEIVHQAYQPYAWQTAWALELCSRLLESQHAPPTTAWSIANSVEIDNVQEMQEAFDQHFLESYDHGEWRMIRQKPEALVRNWTAAMAVADQRFQPVRHRPSLWRRLWRRLVYLWSKIL